MLFWKKTKKAAEPVEVTLEQVRRAVLQYEDDTPETINRLTLVQPDGSLDTNRLARYLGGPSKHKFYLSRETFEIFEEAERHIPYYLDLVQMAVDDYVNETGKLPLVKGSMEGEVDYRALMQDHYLKELPPLPLYLTDQELMLSRHPVSIE
ncbi:hypothetical protein AWM70_05500 [Paenibacillus yonginensis]|uniref:DUF3939 domain-containing protein n=1 Tax=Paenibacillus yonginensis TaxID=1462996 RepID=A0A1B1MY63_9BACL|nr:DUF3939 domain-containing protein [Paenibacillus yonginensis]ANS74097.1 hypothetical protein AWM70_05500 [Paenibacillus yonginensis]